jgi:plasmid stabilization system protein ParE
MRIFLVLPDVWDDIRAAADWYDAQRPGLGAELAASVLTAVKSIQTSGEYVTAPLERLPHAVVRRLFVERFPYRVLFIESDTRRIVIAVVHNRRSPQAWRSRI